MATDLSNKYFIKRHSNDEWEDVTVKFAGVNILKVDGFNELGDAVNVYTEQWQESQTEDFAITGESGNIIRKNVDLSLTFICGERYGAQDTKQCHDNFIDFITRHGDFYIKSRYMDAEAHVICLKSYKPTTQKLKRGGNDSYIIGTIDLHMLSSAKREGEAQGLVYIGFGNSTISSVSSLTNMQQYERDDASGEYTIVCPSTSYLWICTSGTIAKVSANGFIIPMQAATVVGGLNCYRSSVNIIPHTMNFEVTTSM